MIYGFVQMICCGFHPALKVCSGPFNLLVKFSFCHVSYLHVIYLSQ